MTITRARIDSKLGNISLIPADFASAQLNLGIQERIRTRINDLGELIYSRSEASEKRGAFTLNYSQLNPEVLGMMVGHPVETASITDAYFHNTLIAVATKPPVVAGQHGSEMTADNPLSRATYSKNGKTTTLTRQPFTTFAPATAESFAQGAAGTYKFSTDLITAKADVTVFTPYAITDALQLAYNPFGSCEVILQGVAWLGSKKSVYQIRFSEAEVDRTANSQIDPTAETFAINWRDLSPNCVLDVKWLGRTIVC